MTRLYGIKNCDSVKKARQWLDKHGIPYQFHDFRKDGLDKATVQHWLEAMGADKLVNKRCTTWQQLDERQKAVAANNPADLILTHPTLIKRPLLDLNGDLHNGFREADYARIFAKALI